MKKIFLTVALVAGIMASAQVKIGDNVTTLNANSLLELESPSKGVLFPRVALTGTTDATTVGTQIAGMTVYNTATTSDVTPGMYTSNATIWVKLGASAASTLYTADGTITGARTVTQNNNDLTFTTGTGKTIVDGTFKTKSIYGKVVNTGSATSYTVLSDDYIVVTQHSSAVTITLPDATTNAGRIIIVVNNNSAASTVTVTAAAQFAYGMTMAVGRGKHYISDGVKWCAVSYN